MIIVLDPGGAPVLTIVTSRPVEMPRELQEPQAATSTHLHEPSLPPQIAACLGERLRAHYAQLMSEPVPEAFLRILAPLDHNGRPGHGD
jgi:hypothetical protein